MEGIGGIWGVWVGGANTIFHQTTENPELIGHCHKGTPVTSMKGAEDFQLETKSRGEELNALAQAKKILQEALPAAFNQVSFLQLSRSELYTGYMLSHGSLTPTSSY